MDYAAVIRSQYSATLTMLEQAVRKCPPELWAAPVGHAGFWHIAYHALFYVHLYGSADLAAFVPWEKHRPDYDSLGPLPDPPHRMPNIGAPYTPTEILEYAAVVRQHIAQQLRTIDLRAPSGFEWLPMSKFELQIYSMRHLQQHAGELMERLGTHAGISVDWVGMGESTES